MMQSKNKKISQALAFSAALLALSACGKNMHLALDSEGGGALTKSDDASEKLKKGTSTGTDTSTSTSTDASGAKVAGKAIVPNILTALSEFDVSNPPKDLAQFFASPASTMVGQPVFQTDVAIESNKVDFVKNTNVLFRSVIYVPRKEDVKEITSFKLTLKGVTKFNAKGDAKEYSSRSLANQILCIVDQKLCSGDAIALNKETAAGAKIASKVFSEIEMNKVLSKIEDGLVLGREVKEGESTDLVLDMPALFGFELKDSLEWIAKNSTEYSGNGYRKFLFGAGNQVYIAGGSLDLSTTMNCTDNVEAPAPLKNGPTDAIEAVCGPGSAECVKPSADAASLVGDTNTDTSPRTDTSPKTDTTISVGAGGPPSNSADDKPLQSAGNSRGGVVDVATNNIGNNGAVAVGNKPRQMTEQEAADWAAAEAQVNAESDAENNANRSKWATERSSRMAALDKLKTTVKNMGPITSGDIETGVVRFVLDSKSLSFVSGKDLLLPASKARVQKAAKALNKIADLLESIEVVGHSDRTGVRGKTAEQNIKLNQELSLRRATNVSELMKKSGLTVKLENPVGAGQPLTPEDSQCFPFAKNNKAGKCDADRRIDMNFAFKKIATSKELSATDNAAMIKGVEKRVQEFQKEFQKIFR